MDTFGCKGPAGHQDEPTSVFSRQQEETGQGFESMVVVTQMDEKPCSANNKFGKKKTIIVFVFIIILVCVVLTISVVLLIKGRQEEETLNKGEQMATSIPLSYAKSTDRNLATSTIKASSSAKSVTKATSSPRLYTNPTTIAVSAFNAIISAEPVTKATSTPHCHTNPSTIAISTINASMSAGPVTKAISTPLSYTKSTAITELATFTIKTSAAVEPAIKEPSCQKTLELLYQNKCYFWISKENRIVNYETARSMCLHRRSRLADIISEEHQAVVEKYVRENYISYLNFVNGWTGLDYSQSDNLVIMANGTSVSLSSYRWKKHAPSGSETKLAILVEKDSASTYQGLFNFQSYRGLRGALCVKL